MTDYHATFSESDRQRVFRFLATFSRAEYALKRGGFLRSGKHGQAEASWNAFADAVGPTLLEQKTPDFIKGVSYLRSKPPERLMAGDNGPQWAANPRRPQENDGQYLLRVVRDVRNNLFHCGKYPVPDGPQPELARDGQLLDAALTVLGSALRINQAVWAEYSATDASQPS